MLNIQVGKSTPVPVKLLANFGPAGPAGPGGLLAATLSIAGDLQLHNGVARWYPPRNVRTATFEAWVGDAPIGGNVTAAIMLNGGSQVIQLTIPEGQNAILPVAGVADLTPADYLTVNVTEVGDAVPGSNLNVRIIFES